MKIVDALTHHNQRAVIEIGPGTGVLTNHLVGRHADFQAFDVDLESIDYLKATFPTYAHLFLHQDYLKSDLANKSTAIIGNFPYNISSQIFFKIWDDRKYISEVVCMIQKEVADRICATHGNKTYGILSVLLQAFYTVDFLFKVPPGAFNPPPKVISAVIRLTRNAVGELPCDEGMFKKIVKAGFGKRRKTLRNALKDLNLPGLENGRHFLDKRAEQLSVDDFIALTQKVTA